MELDLSDRRGGTTNRQGCQTEKQKSLSRFRQARVLIMGFLLGGAELSAVEIFGENIARIPLKTLQSLILKHDGWEEGRYGKVWGLTEIPIILKLYVNLFIRCTPFINLPISLGDKERPKENPSLIFILATLSRSWLNKNSHSASR
jgi:hypothetical protein